VDAKNLKREDIIPVNVGVVLDFDNDLDGKIGLSCINMSLLDFYDTHGDYKTRLVLITKDSKNDVAGAAAAGSPSLPPLS
jgi:ionotropic glutamate receptor